MPNIGNFIFNERNKQILGIRFLEFCLHDHCTEEKPIYEYTFL